MKTENDIRCGSCSRKLGSGEFTLLQIKCPRCGTMNHLRATRPDPERHRASTSMTTDGQENPAQGPRPQRL